MAAVPDLIFPSKSPVPAPGTPFPRRLTGDPSKSSNAADAAGFLRSDYEGWASLAAGNHPRINWVADPLGSGLSVMQMEVFGDDNADQWGGTRCTIGSDKSSDQKEGNSGWASMAVLLPTGFQRPDQWMLIWQNFSTGGNPAQAIEFRAKSGSTRDTFYWKNQHSQTGTREYYELGPAFLNRWHYFLWYIDFTTSNNGRVAVWYSIDKMPNPDVDPSKVDVRSNTLYSGGGVGSKCWLAMYRGAAAHSQHQVMLYRGYRRSGNLAVARAMP
jgi:Polysaccharide lyase